MFATVIAITKDLPDVEGDRRYNIDTLATRFGPRTIAFTGGPSAAVARYHHRLAWLDPSISCHHHLDTWQQETICEARQPLSSIPHCAVTLDPRLIVLELHGHAVCEQVTILAECK